MAVSMGGIPPAGLGKGPWQAKNSSEIAKARLINRAFNGFSFMMDSYVVSIGIQMSRTYGGLSFAALSFNVHLGRRPILGESKKVLVSQLRGAFVGAFRYRLVEMINVDRKILPSEIDVSDLTARFESGQTPDDILELCGPDFSRCIGTSFNQYEMIVRIKIEDSIPLFGKSAN